MKSIIEWFDTKECPDDGRPILAFTNNQRFMAIKNCEARRWSWLVDKYSIAAWAYQDEIKVV